MACGVVLPSRPSGNHLLGLLHDELENAWVIVGQPWQRGLGGAASRIRTYATVLLYRLEDPRGRDLRLRKRKAVHGTEAEDLSAETNLEKRSRDIQRDYCYLFLALISGDYVKTKEDQNTPSLFVYAGDAACYVRRSNQLLDVIWACCYSAGLARAGRRVRMISGVPTTWTRMVSLKTCRSSAPDLERGGASRDLAVGCCN